MIMPYSVSDKCIGCGKCRSRCSSGAIKLIGGRCVIDPDLCVACGHCAYFCERSALIDADGRPVAFRPLSERKKPHIDASRCTGCMLCVESCPEFALAITKYCAGGVRSGYAFLNGPELCLGCGHCAASCPMRAITLV